MHNIYTYNLDVIYDFLPANIILENLHAAFVQSYM